LPNGVKALFPESHVAYADCVGFHHAGRTALNAADYAPAALLSKSKENADLNRHSSKKSPACRESSKRGSFGVRLLPAPRDGVTDATASPHVTEL
jgi:hypothetical protein